MASYTTPTATQFYRSSWSMDMAKEYLYDTQDDYCFFQIQHGAGVPDVYVLVTGNYVDTSNNQYIFEDATYYTFQNNMNLGVDVTINSYDDLYVPVSGDGKQFTSIYHKKREPFRVLFLFCILLALLCIPGIFFFLLPSFVLFALGFQNKTLQILFVSCFWMFAVL